MKRNLVMFGLIGIGSSIGIKSIDAGGMPPTGSFAEEEGSVIIEAEHARVVGDWHPISVRGAYGRVMRDGGERGKTGLSFTVKVSTPGRYFVWFRHAKPPQATDDANDCFVSVNGRPLLVNDGLTAHPVIGMGTHQKKLAFESRPKTHHAELRRFRPYFDVDEPGSVTFEVRSRAVGYMIDTIALVHADAGGDTESPSILSKYERDRSNELTDRELP